MSNTQVKQSIYANIEEVIDAIGSESDLGKFHRHAVRLSALAVTLSSVTGTGTEMMNEVNRRKKLQDRLSILVEKLVFRLSKTTEDLALSDGLSYTRADEESESIAFSEVLEACSRTLIVLSGRKMF